MNLDGIENTYVELPELNLDDIIVSNEAKAKKSLRETLHSNYMILMVFR